MVGLSAKRSPAYLEEKIHGELVAPFIAFLALTYMLTTSVHLVPVPREPLLRSRAIRVGYSPFDQRILRDRMREDLPMATGRCDDNDTVVPVNSRRTSIRRKYK